MATRYMTAQQAKNEGIITESEWDLAIASPWTWVVLPSGVKVREIPWQGLEVFTPDQWCEHCGLVMRLHPTGVSEETSCDAALTNKRAEERKERELCPPTS